jgi:hypothetical protein
MAFASAALGRPLAGHEPALAPARASRPLSVSRSALPDPNGRLLFRRYHGGSQMG